MSCGWTRQRAQGVRHTGVATSIPSGVLETVEKQARGAYTRHGPIAAPVAMRLARSHSQLGCSADHVCSVHVERLQEVQTIRRRGYTRCRRAVIVVHQTREHDSEYCSSAQHCVEHHGGHVAPQVRRDAGLVRAQDRDGPEQVPPAMRNTRSTHLLAAALPNSCEILATKQHNCVRYGRTPWRPQR